MADGEKLEHFVVVVFKGIQPIAELNRVPGVIVVVSPNRWIHEALTVEFVEKVWGHMSFSGHLLVSGSTGGYIV